MGGAPDDILLEYMLGLAPGKRLLYVPTAGMEDPARTGLVVRAAARARRDDTHALLPVAALRTR
jgi:hypothetical protein